MSRARATRALRRNASTLAVAEAGSAVAESVFNEDTGITTVPTLIFAGAGDTVYVLMSTALTAGSGATGAWVVRINAASQTVSSVLFAASGLITITLSASNLKPITEAVQAIDVAYTASGTDDLVDGLGRNVPNWTAARGIAIPRIDTPEGAFYLMKEQSGAPTHVSGYGIIYWLDDGTFHILDDAGNDIDLTNTYAIASETASLAAAVENAYNQLVAGEDFFNPGAAFTEQADSPDTPGSGTDILYFDTSGNLKWKMDDGTIRTVTFT